MQEDMDAGDLSASMSLCSLHIQLANCLTPLTKIHTSLKFEAVNRHFYVRVRGLFRPPGARARPSAPLRGSAW
ncbi:hypothetical protein HNQ99_003079 [Rhizorhapis suberifaciens]|uniref:Uncharacterized protein n=1 Tax=Rhizorhapis suberifaciens TaxID=13656 RepID=A0A840HXM1_9SPHN|nr:hypothetical protein [Rhizorhapis suberifaciens]